MAWDRSHLNQDRDVTGRCERGIPKLYDSGNFFTARGTYFLEKCLFTLELVMECEILGLVFEMPHHSVGLMCIVC
jgi:hypothetical protein